MGLVLLPSVACNCYIRYCWVLSALSLECLFKAFALSQNGDGHSGIPRHLLGLTHASTLMGDSWGLWECEPFRYQQMKIHPLYQVAERSCIKPFKKAVAVVWENSGKSRDKIGTCVPPIAKCFKFLDFGTGKGNLATNLGLTVPWTLFQLLCGVFV